VSARSDREDYLSLVIHELRNPLVGIDATARVLARELGSHPGSKRAAAIASEARHLLAMLESVADAEAAAAGRLRSHLRPVDLVALVRETVAGMHFDGRVVTIAGADEPLMVHADVGRVRQVLTNLLVNAAQYSPPATPIDVVVRADPRRGSASVEVHDRGPGIPAGERRRLFKKFTRLSTADGTRGSGLGLYICRAIVAEHGGRIAFEGGGGRSTFAFTLPLAAGVSRRVAAPRAPARVGGHPTRTAGPRRSGSESRPRRGSGERALPKRLLASVRPRGARRK
jgi:signal transduction histidine kinase